MIEILSNINYCYAYFDEYMSSDLILYSHIPTSLVALIFSIFLIYKRRNVASYSLLFVSIFFFLWCFFNLNAWFAFMGAHNTMFNWSLIDLSGILFFLFTYRFLYGYIYDRELPTWQILSLSVLISPIFITTFFGLNLIGFNLDTCEAVENDWIVSYAYYLQFLFVLASLYLGVHSFIHLNETRVRQEILLATLGVTLFLAFFTGSSFIVDFLATHTEISNPYNYEIYGLFGMPVLLVFLGYLIVKYQAFEIKLVGAQVIVVVLGILVGSQLFFSSSTAGFTVNLATLFLVLCFGYFLVKSVKKEIAQREQIEELVSTLSNANIRLKELDKMKSEFVSIASHQLRSPLTTLRGYASMLAEGSYGKLPAKVLEIVEKIADSSKFMSLSVEDYLNVSRIEAGNMKYEMCDHNLKVLVEKIVDDMRTTAIKKGLLLLFKSDCEGNSMVHVDVGKARQIIINLIDNAIKYTPKGSITVLLHDDLKEGTIRVSISDTGIGMSEESLAEVFEKFVRAKNASNVNVTGTGLGLYVAKRMVTDMHGKVWAESEGPGKGTTFHVEFLLVSKGELHTTQLQ